MGRGGEGKGEKRRGKRSLIVEAGHSGKLPQSRGRQVISVNSRSARKTLSQKHKGEKKPEGGPSAPWPSAKTDIKAVVANFMCVCMTVHVCAPLCMETCEDQRSPSGVSLSHSPPLFYLFLHPLFILIFETGSLYVA